MVVRRRLAPVASEPLVETEPRNRSLPGMASADRRTASDHAALVTGLPVFTTSHAMATGWPATAVAGMLMLAIAKSAGGWNTPVPPLR